MKFKLKQIIFYINSIIYKTVNLAIKIIIPILIITISSNVKAQVGSNYINYPTSPRIIHILQGELSSFYNLHNANDQAYTIWGGLGQGYVIFTLASSNGSANGTSQLLSVEVASQTRHFQCEMGTLATYIDNTTEMNLYTVKCPVDFSDGYGWKQIWFQRNNMYNDIYISISNTATYVSEVSDAAAITSSQQQAATAQITAIQNQAVETRTHIDNAATSISNAIANEIQAQATQWGNFMNEDARQGDGDSSRPDDQIVDDTIDAEQDVINTINDKLNVVQQVIVTIDDFENAFEWIWYVIDSAFHTHLILFSFLIIMLWIGLIKLILCR